MFLHTPLTLTERHGHQVKDFPEPPSDAPLGVDATVAEGWLDLRVRNDTEVTFQIAISFDQAHITGRVYTARDLGLTYEAINEKPGVLPPKWKGVRGSGRGAARHRHLLRHLRVHPADVPESMRNRLPVASRYGGAGERMRHMKQKPIAVLFGGRSPEYEVSLASAAGVLEHMDRRRYLPVMVGITQQGEWYHFTGSIGQIAAGAWQKRTGLHPGPPLPQPQGPKSSGISGGSGDAHSPGRGVPHPPR